MTTPTRGDYDISTVEGIDALMSCLKKFNQTENHDDRVKIISDLLMNGHEGVGGYLTFGNNKIAKNTGIFNMNSATDCPNAGTTKENQSDTGMCQVPFNDCYAHVAEKQYDRPLPKRRLQEYLWDNVDAITFSDAILHVKSRKRSSFEYLRVSEAGDFRHDGDIVKWNTIAKELSGEIDIYTYSASHKLNWDKATHFTVNQSNALADYGDRLFSAVADTENIPDDAIFCPFEAAKRNGVDTDDRPKCGECTACVEPNSEQSKDVYITVH